MLRRISLANKCLLLFGLAVVVIIGGALSIALLRMNSMIDEGELASMRQALLVFKAEQRRLLGSAFDVSKGPQPSPERLSAGELEIVVYMPEHLEGLAERIREENRPVMLRAWRAILDDPKAEEVTEVRWGLGSRRYTVVMPVRALAGKPVGPNPGDSGVGAGGVSNLVAPGTGPSAAATAPNPTTPPIPDPIPGPASTTPASSLTPDAATTLTTVAAPRAGQAVAMVAAIKQSSAAATSLWLSLIFLLSVGIFALGLAVLVFYLITSKIILEPVRQLRGTAENVRSGNLDTRSDIETGDEFEELAEAFNEMLGAIATGQEQLRAINASLDEKINQLAERNTTLYEAARIKGEFLANVSHELRTPLNSVLGFAEMLEEQAQRDAEAGDESGKLAKRRRYIENILSAGRSLLELINGLLEMAKVEAGKVELKIKPIQPRDLCEQLLAMMRPQADKRQVELSLELAENLTELRTDQGKLQQVIFNLLSNAVKFTGDMADELRSKAQVRASEAELSGLPQTEESLPPAKVILRVEPLITRNPETGETEDRVRFSVLDTGPGIAPEDQARIFDKFTQLDSGYGRKHAGTGLGLAICKELTSVLQGEMQIQSQLGRGSMFSVIIPTRLDQALVDEKKLELAFRGTLSNGKSESAA